MQLLVQGTDEKKLDNYVLEFRCRNAEMFCLSLCRQKNADPIRHGALGIIWAWIMLTGCLSEPAKGIVFARPYTQKLSTCVVNYIPSWHMQTVGMHCL